MADSDLTAELDRIRADIEETATVYNLDGTGKNSYPVSAAMVRHARPLLAAVEAAQRIAGEWEQDAAYAAARAERSLDKGEPPAASALLSGRAQAKKDCADELITAITREITGKEESDGGRPM